MKYFSQSIKTVAFEKDANRSIIDAYNSHVVLNGDYLRLDANNSAQMIDWFATFTFDF